MLDKGFRGQEGVVFLGELLDKLLVFVKPCKGVRVVRGRSAMDLLL